ncbi:hypothetical protein RDI58_015791 [Solanum bulbocastanum]|uniref:AIG1-type G domain-containing protein n=1 Tax=Solanum bulbocastanum TaxID=147425 RepID=A0AAN8TP00_SOLBU
MNGGSAFLSDGWELATNEARTIVLVGHTGDGKSSTGNSILGKYAFRSMPQSTGVTSTCEVQTTQLQNGQILDVIDTPDGIHAVLLVLSVRSRFSREHQAAIQSFQEFFGNKINDYMIVVFTGGDDLEASRMTLDDYFGANCPEPLQVVLFDNRTEDSFKKVEQLKELLFQVDLIVEKNDGKPYTNNLFKELKVESRLKEIMRSLEKQLEEDRVARLAAEQNAKEAQMKPEDETRKLKVQQESSKKEIKELRHRMPQASGRCNIL